MEAGPLLHVVASSRGGGAVHTLELSTALAGRGYAVTVAMPEDGGHVLPDAYTSRGVAFESLGDAVPGTTAAARRLAAVIGRSGAATVHAHGFRAAVWSRAALLGRRSGRVRLIYSVHGFATPFYSGPRRLLQQLALASVARRASAIIACCEAERGAVQAAASAARVVAIPYGMDLSGFARRDDVRRAGARTALEVPADAWLLVMVCRLDRPRDFESLIGAFRVVVEAFPNARLYLVGDGPDRPRIEALIAGEGLGDRVRLWGFRDDVPSFFAAADAAVLTSWGWEGLPLSVIEAQAAGLPVVVTDAGGSGEAIAPEETGLLVPCRDPGALATALRRLAGDPDDSARMGRRGRERALALFDPATMVERIEAEYARAAAS